ncbi:TetR family transcriptional regulator [Amycolatopsis sp. NBRC 101858]|uniref:TetR/AcrR family transcriptional regulator C-terminal domain-containing protein n=1 Tax=Amycolatopsis sp. NBRC 101858 TaxID=3032200 RepID=UPI0024A25107|nr:TetR/AcrR family transcriptional regulator C-terminal domain-containing protein [Amycolatopsis sp. NBRC 101858]GLY44252.1 TetR family transcriptional regulator [Amycolatopsis sp. NBRC 101858]
MVVFAGQGDARRSMELLWGPRVVAPRTGPGPKPGLSVEAIVAAAIDIADADGMAALSMRSVGERLGRTAMALYTYVPGKTELVDLMYDRTLGELPSSYPSPDWRSAALALADELWDLHLRHPWLLQVSPARPVLGPGEFHVQETLLSVLAATGLPLARVRWVVSALFNIVRGSVQAAAESRQAARETGLSEEDWWYARSALLGELVPDLTARFPTVSRLGSEGEYESSSDEPYLEREARLSFEAGLELLLDGVEAAIVKASGPR